MPRCRLTNKDTHILFARNNGKTYISNCMQKLSQLEDIEEEFAKVGIDLIPFLQETLCKINNGTLYMVSRNLEKQLFKELGLIEQLKGGVRK